MDQPTQAQTGSRGDQEGRVYPDPMPLTHDIM